MRPATRRRSDRSLKRLRHVSNSSLADVRACAGHARPLTPTLHAHQELGVALGLLQPVTQQFHRVGRFMSLSTRRSMQTRRYSSGSSSISSRRVPLPLMSMAGQIRLSTSLRSSTISRLPVPLNSSKITSSILLPVSTRAVAMIVSEPPSSTLRAEPKNRLGRCKALASTPPERILPECGHFGVPGPGQPRDRIEKDDHVVAVLDHPLGLFDDHLRHLDVPGRRLVERRADHFAVRPFDLPLHVGHFFRPLVDQQHDHVDFRMVGEHALAIFCSRIVLPARGGLTIKPRWPKPIGTIRSTTRMLISSAVVSSTIALVGMQRRQIVEEDFLARAGSDPGS